MSTTTTTNCELILAYVLQILFPCWKMQSAVVVAFWKEPSPQRRSAWLTFGEYGHPSILATDCGVKLEVDWRRHFSYVIREIPAHKWHDLEWPLRNFFDHHSTRSRVGANEVSFELWFES